MKATLTLANNLSHEKQNLHSQAESVAVISLIDERNRNLERCSGARRNLEK
jgi:hypothetical protein